MHNPSGVSGHVSGQVDLKFDSIGSTKDEPLKEVNNKHLEEYPISNNRQRVISTADNQFRKKKTKNLVKEEKSHQYKSELQGESLDEITEDHKLKDNIFVETRHVTGEVSRTNKR